MKNGAIHSYLAFAEWSDLMSPKQSVIKISDNTLSFQGENGGKNLDFKSTVSVIFSDTQCKDGYMSLHTVPMKLFLINNVEDFVIFLGLKVFSCDNF